MNFRERMLASASSRKSRVVLGLDFADAYGQRRERAKAVLEATRESVAAVKVNHHLLLPFGLEGLGEVIDMCREEELPLIADLKINDIESTNLNIVDSLLAYGFDAVIANPFVGREEGLGEVIERAHSRNGGVILLVYMSHRGAEEGYGLRLQGGEPLYRAFAERARDWGADGVVVSAKASDKIAETRKIVGKECLIFAPGVGAQGGDLKAGAGHGADFVIVGRGITEASDPGKAVRELNASQPRS
ncbi:MAG TPA: orotidine 5'-phosphate decarboxylase [Nitrososphaerales archaeon]|nr:orotidine 5'-phosphate decarboxylase [Nitrososphaerales archaeon]